MTKTIFVTGGAGYIGAHACKALARAGFVPVTYDNLSTGHAYAVKWGPLIEGELADKAKLKTTFQQYRPAAVFHFAADALVTESMKEPAKYYRNNLVSTLSLLEIMREMEVKKLVFSSSCATYGNPQCIPMTETHPQLPINPYGRTKWMAEQMIRDFDAAYGLKAVTLRYFNAAGADPEIEIGEHHEHETHLIPLAIEAALGCRPPITLYGTDFPTRDGSAVRDYVHVQDLAEAHLLALYSLLQGQESAAFNLGTGRGSSIFEILSAIETCTGKKVPYQLEKRRAGEPAILEADPAKALALLNWTPKLSAPSDLIRTAWPWHEKLRFSCSLLPS
jgi:UDP-arabinose 4-epimerase